MKFRYIIIILALFSGTLSSLAQQNQKTKTSKFVYATHFGFSTGIGTLAFDERHWDNSLNLFKIQQFLAYQFNNYITFGISGGIDIWKKTAFIPLSLSLNVNFIDRKLVPFWFLNTGYSFKWYGSQRPDAMQRVIYGSTAGLYGETGIGMKINMNEKIAFLISANYTVQQSSIKYSREGTEGSFSLLYTNSQQRMLYHFLGLKLGILY